MNSGVKGGESEREDEGDVAMRKQWGPRAGLWALRGSEQTRIFFGQDLSLIPVLWNSFGTSTRPQEGN